MARDAVYLRDDRGGRQQVEISDDGSVSVGGRAIAVHRTRAGEMQAGRHTLWAAGDGDARWVFLDGQVYTFEVEQRGGSIRRRMKHEGGLSAPMPATVIRILTAPGHHVRAGDVVMILEAMKMELPVRATADGVVSSVRCREGELVQPGQDLMEIAPGSGSFDGKQGVEAR